MPQWRSGKAMSKIRFSYTYIDSTRAHVCGLCRARRSYNKFIASTHAGAYGRCVSFAGEQQPIDDTKIKTRTDSERKAEGEYESDRELQASSSLRTRVRHISRYSCVYSPQHATAVLSRSLVLLPSPLPCFD